jgi:hypothetical protein
MANSFVTIVIGTHVIVVTVDSFKFTLTSFFTAKVISAIIIIITNDIIIVTNTFNTEIGGTFVVIITNNMSKNAVVSLNVTVIYGTEIFIITDNTFIFTSIVSVARLSIARNIFANYSSVLTTRCSTAGINSASIVVFAVNNFVLTLSGVFTAAIYSTFIVIIAVNMGMSDLSIFLTFINGT